MNSSYLALLRTAWQYARHEKRQYGLVYVLFVLANSVAALHPLLLGWFVESFQPKRSEALQLTFRYAGGFMTLKIVEWVFYGLATRTTTGV